MKKIIYLLATLLLFSCHKESDPNHIKTGLVDVVFTATLPDPIEIPTRAAYSDSDIANIDLLIFDQTNRFIERIKVNTISGSGATKSFTARLDASSTPRTIHVVANGRNSADADRINFSVITPLMLESAAIPTLVSTPMTTAQEEDILPLIMWGRISLAAVTSQTAVNNLKFIRSSACIQVSKATAMGANGLSDFEIVSATLHSAASAFKVAPVTYNAAPTSAPTTPNEYAAARINYYTNNGYIAPGTTPKLYLYERINTQADYVALIINGRWKGVSGYYKVILKDDAGNVLNIVRNHRYMVTIIKAFGTGYPTIADAISNQASNIQVSIADQRNELHFVQADGTGELGVSSNILKLWGSAVGTIDIVSVFATRNSSLSATSSVSGVSSLTFTAADGNGIRTLRGTWSGSTAQSGTITITDGLLNHTVTVTIVPSLSTIANSSDADSYCHNLFTSSNGQWFAEVESGTNNVRLHNALSSALSYSTGSSFGYSYLDSRLNGNNAFLHIANTGGSASIKVSYMNGGELNVGKIIVNR